MYNNYFFLKNGELVRDSFSHATALGFLMYSSKYRGAFKKELPDWFKISYSHYEKILLMQQAIEAKRPISDDPPLPIKFPDSGFHLSEKVSSEIDTVSKPKRILYIDMDNVLVDFPSAFKHFDNKTLKKYDSHKDDIPGIFEKMEPVKGAISAYKKLARIFDTYILSTAPWDNSTAWNHKLEWVKIHLGKVAYKRLILTHHKNLNYGDFLIDDRTKNGVDRFTGEHIHFGTPKFSKWNKVVRYLLEKKG